MYANDLLENKNLREELADRIEVLDKVKKLVLLEGTDFLTIDKVAEYYEVPEKTIQTICLRNDDELLSDGMTTLTRKSLSLQNEGLANITEERYRITIRDANGNQIVIPNRGVRIFPKRAILRVGMLLRDSRVAVEVRNQLLNISEKVDQEVAVEDIDMEKSLALKITEALLRNDTPGVFAAFAEFNEFKNRHIQELEKTNHALADGELTWNDRSKLNAMVRKLSIFANIDFGNMWQKIYKNLKYKYGIDLKLRANGRRPYLDHLKESEWPMMNKVFAAICESHGYQLMDIAKNCGFGIDK